MRLHNRVARRTSCVGYFEYCALIIFAVSVFKKIDILLFVHIAIEHMIIIIAIDNLLFRKRGFVCRKQQKPQEHLCNKNSSKKRQIFFDIEPDALCCYFDILF